MKIFSQSKFLKNLLIMFISSTIRLNSDGLEAFIRNSENIN
jgi:hypothetical protein